MNRIPILTAGVKPSPIYLKVLKKAIASDACSGAPDIYAGCCVLHDLAYKYGIDCHGLPVRKRDADRILRRCMQATSPLGQFSPISWIYWLAVGHLGFKAYAEDVDARPTFVTYIFG